MKNLSTLSDEQLLDFINELVRERVEEGLTHDYKANIDINKDGDKRELAKDVTGFANAVGGAVIIGIPEEKNGNAPGKPTTDIGIERINQFESRVQSILRNGCTPMLPSLHARELALDDNKYLYIVYHPQSWLEPHMVSAWGAKRYHRRVGDNTLPMSEHEIDEAYARRRQKGVTTDKHIRSLRKATSVFNSPQGILRTTFVPLPIRKEQFDFVSTAGQALLKANPFFVAHNASGWDAFGDHAISIQNRKTPEESTYITTLYSCGSLIYENRYLADEAGVTIEHVLGIALHQEVQTFLTKWIQSVGLVGRGYIRIELAGLGAGNLSAGRTGMRGIFDGEHKEYLVENDLTVDMEFNLDEFLNDPNQLIQALRDKLARLIGLWSL